jgi:hypothetical protein
MGQRLKLNFLLPFERNLFELSIEIGTRFCIELVSRGKDESLA